MSVSVTMPRLGESVSEGTVTRWLKKEGDRVEADEPLLEVSTDKVDTEIPSPSAGVITTIRVQEDETVEVGAELAVIDDGASGSGAASGSGEQSTSTGSTDSGPSAAAPPRPAPPAPAPPAPAPPAPAPPAPAPQPAPMPAQRSQPQPWSAQSEWQPRHAGPPADEASLNDGGRQEPSATETPAETPPQEPASADAGGGDTVSVVLPALGESVQEGTVTRWLKQEGEQVRADEPLLEVSTDKVDTEIPAPASGVLTSIRVREDETVAVGTELAVISGAGAPAQAPAAASAASAAPAPPAAPAPASTPAPAPAAAGRVAAPVPAPTPAPTQVQSPQPGAPASEAPSQEGDGGEVSAYVTPLVRKLATEHQVDLSTVKGTGVGGRIRKQDVLETAKTQEAARAAQRAQPAPAAPAAAAPAQAPAQQAPAASALRGRTEKMSRLRSLMATRLVESLQTAAQLTTVVEVDVTNIARLRERAKADFEAREGVRLSFLPFFALATVEALKQHPVLNASIDSEAGTVTYHDAEHLGIAVDTERGLIAPVIHNAGDLNLGGLARKIADLAERTRSNKVSPDELGGGTFTLTNTGSRGALFDTPIINQPQVGILGTGAVVKRPVVVSHPDLGETISIRSMVYLALTYDHRLVDGADAARFLSTVKARLEEGRFASELGLA